MKANVPKYGESVLTEGISGKPGEETIEHLTRQVAKGGGIAFIGSVIGKVATFGLHILLGRVLGPGVYGVYALGTSVTGIAQSVASLGLNEGVIRFSAMYRGVGDNARVKGTILAALAISSISSVVAAAVLFGFSRPIAERFFHETDLVWVLRVFAMALPFYVLMGITTSFAQSFRRIGIQQGIQNIFRPLFNLVLVGLAFLLGFRLAGAVYGFLVSGIVSAVLGFYFLWRIFPEVVRISNAVYQTAQLARFSVPMFLIGISYFLLTYTDRIMLGYFRKASDVGVYNAATVIALQMTIFLGAFISIFSPMVSDLHNRGNRKELESLFTTTTKWILSLTLPLFIILMIFSKSIMLIFGPKFIGGWIVLIILALAQLVNVGTGPVGMFLQMTGRQDIDCMNGIILLLLNIGLNGWLIPIYGTLGAAIATGVSLILVHIARLVQVVMIFKMIPYDARYIKPITAAMTSTLVAIIMTTNFIDSPSWLVILIASIILLMVYAAVLYWMGLDHEDKVVLKAIRAKILKVF